MTCARRACTRDRQRDSLFCREDLNLYWAGRLERQDDGTFTAVAVEAEWVRRRNAGLLPAKDMTGARA